MRLLKEYIQRTLIACYSIIGELTKINIFIQNE